MKTQRSPQRKRRKRIPRRDPLKLGYDICLAYLRDLQYHYPQHQSLWEAILGKLRNRDLAALTGVSEMYFCPEYHGAEVLRHLLQIEAFFSKNKSFAREPECSIAALEAFRGFEEQCERTNLLLYLECVEQIQPDFDLDLLLAEMRLFIRRVLGDFKRDFLGVIPQLVDITDGASARSKRKDSYPYRKVKYKVDAPLGSGPYLDALYAFWGYKRPRKSYLVSNRVGVVLKNWKTHRTIACEPEGAIPFQLAFDSYVKDRLRSIAGINLRDQSLNQRLALIGSILGIIATIDLKGASDTVARRLVHLVFDEEWREFLEAFRSPCYFGPFGTGVYSKFSSMGNGCTFGIETLIFAAVCSSCNPDVFNVYGDDIAISTEKADELVEKLHRLGFIVNQDKSHTSGSFRESCGANWYQGQDVTPFYVRTSNLGLAPERAHVVNGLVAIGIPGGELWKLAKELTLEADLQIVPFDDNSTSGVWVDHTTASETKLFRRKRSTMSLQYKRYTQKVKLEYEGDLKTVFLWHFYRSKNQSPRNEKHWAFDRSVNYDNLRISSSWDDLPYDELSKGIDDLKTSSVRHDQHKFARSWGHWLAPAKATPPHLFWWGDYLIRS